MLPFQLHDFGARGAASDEAAGLGGAGHLGAFDEADGAVFGDEGLVGHAADVGLADLVIAVELAEEFAPVTEAGLEDGQLCGQAGVGAETADEVGLGARLHALQLFIGDVLVLQPFELGVDGVTVEAELLEAVAVAGLVLGLAALLLLERRGDLRAVVVAVKALVDAAMREAQPDQSFPGYTDTADLADAIHGIVGGDAPNGARRDLTEA